MKQSLLILINLLFIILLVDAGNNNKDNNNNNKDISKLKIEDNKLPVIPMSMKYSIPYTFTECVEDLKSIITTLLNDIANNKNNNNYNNNNVNNVNNDNNFLEYTIDSFSKQVIELCSPDSYNSIYDEFKLEFNSGKYPKVCKIKLESNSLEKSPEISDNLSSNSNNNNNNNYKHIDIISDDCFQLVLQIDQRIKNRKLLKGKLLSNNNNGNNGKSSNERKAVNKNKLKTGFENNIGNNINNNDNNMQNNDNILNNRLSNFRNLKNVYNDNDNNNFELLAKKDNNKKQDNNKKNKNPYKTKTETKTSITIQTETELSIQTTTVQKTLFKATNKPTLIHDFITTTELIKETETKTEIDKLTTTIYQNRIISSTTTVTDILIDVSISTTSIARKTIVENKFITSTTIDFTTIFKDKFITSLPSDLSFKANAIINGNGNSNIIKAKDFPIFVETLFTKTETVTNNNFAIVSRVCDAVTRVGLNCPARLTSNSNTIPQQTASNVNINVNVIDNKGYVRVLNTDTTTINNSPQTTSTIIKTTTTTATTIKTKVKLITKSKTVTTTTTKSIIKHKTHECDDEDDSSNHIHDNDENTNEMTDDFFDDFDDMEQFKVSPQLINGKSKSITFKRYDIQNLTDIETLSLKNGTIIRQFHNSTSIEYESGISSMEKGSLMIVVLVSFIFGVGFIL